MIFFVVILPILLLLIVSGILGLLIWLINKFNKKIVEIKDYFASNENLEKARLDINDLKSQLKNLDMLKQKTTDEITLMFINDKYNDILAKIKSKETYISNFHKS